MFRQPIYEIQYQVTHDGTFQYELRCTCLPSSSCINRLLVECRWVYKLKHHSESCDSVIVLWQVAGKQGQPDLLFCPVATCSLAALSISSFPPGIVLRITTRTQKTTLTVGEQVKQGALHHTVLCQWA